MSEISDDKSKAKKNGQEQPSQDAPLQGAPPQDTSQYATKEDLTAFQTSIKETLDNLCLRMETFGQPQPIQQSSMPQGPSLSEQLADIDKELGDIEGKIDTAVYEGKGVGDLLRKQRALVEKRADLKSADQLKRFEQFGLDALGNLSERVTQTQMPYLEIPEVKRDYDNAVLHMTPEARANVQARQAAYSFAVGNNMSKIVDLAVEKHLRASDTSLTETQDQTRQTSREQSSIRDRVPAPKDVLAKENLDAIEISGRTVDQYYRSLGYAGWEDFYNRRGRAYFEGEEQQEETA